MSALLTLVIDPHAWAARAAQSLTSLLFRRYKEQVLALPA